MSEWWNLDQALIWIVTRDPEQVELAEGDADGTRERAHCYLGLTELGSKEEDRAVEMEHDEDGVSSFEFLLRLLRAGKVSAIRADDETGARLPSSIFGGLEIGPHDAKPTLTFRKPTPPIDASLGRTRGEIPVLLWRSDIVKWAPEKASGDLLRKVEELAQPPRDQEHTPAPPTMRKRGKSGLYLRAVELIAELYPSGFPTGEAGYGAQGKAIRRIHNRLNSEGWDVDLQKVKTTIRRAGGAKRG